MQYTSGKLICAICGFEGWSLAPHVPTHNITVKEYKERFNLLSLNHPDLDKSHKDKMVANNPTKGKQRTEEEKTLISKNRIGKGIGISGKYERTADIREKISDSVSEAHRRGDFDGIYNGGMYGKRGEIFSVKMNTVIHYRSTWEKRFIQCLDVYSRVNSFWYEPLSIDYIFNGIKHKYTPDFLVCHDEHIFSLWEIKRADLLATDMKTQAKINALTKFCTDNLYNMFIVDLKELERMEKILGLKPGK